jgi:cell wall-associated NlpC family hydrolase
MPSRPRSLLLACAFAALVFACAAFLAVARSGVTNAQAGSSGPDRANPARDLPTPARHSPKRVLRKPTLGARAATIALKAVGVPYRWGGASPASGFDCSGLVYWAYGKLGVELPHSSYALYDLGRRVRRSRLRPGDLLFFYGLDHMGMYIGHGRMVHAPSSGRLVEIVKLRGSNYGSRLVGARRIVPR